MGIKFHCPNGHKLNVKSFLAGKKGICPHCGVSVRIPAGEANVQDDHEGEADITTGGAATAVLTKSMADTVTVAATFAVPTAAVAPVATPVTLPTSVSPVVAVPATPVISSHVAAAPVAAVATPMVPAAVPMAVQPTVPVAMAAPVVGAPLAPSPYAIVPTAPVDPIDEAPNAVWYVRPPSGGQFGPARGDIMRKWLGEGRVSADSLVWRDGWQDWKNAAFVFPSLAPTGAPAATMPGEGLTVATLAKTSSSRAPRSKKSSNSLAIGMVIMLGLVAIVLLGVFIFVLMGMNQA